MGNVMTPFFPPKAAFINRVTNLLASTSFSTVNGIFRTISHAEAENNILYISGSATNATTVTATTKTEYFDLPTTASAKVYTFNVGNVTLATAFSYTLGVTTARAGTAVDFDVSTSFQVAYSATGYGSSGEPTVRKLSATNIAFAS
jgi:hypothetical protein